MVWSHLPQIYGKASRRSSRQISQGGTCSAPQGRTVEWDIDRHVHESIFMHYRHGPSDGLTGITLMDMSDCISSAELKKGIILEDIIHASTFR